MFNKFSNQIPSVGIIKDLSGVTSDFYLNPGDIAFKNFTVGMGLSIPIGITTVEGMYELNITSDQSLSVTNNTVPTILANNKTQSANIQQVGHYTTMTGGSVGYFNNGSATNFAFDGGLLCFLNMVVYTYTKNKVMAGTFLSKETDLTPRLFVMSYLWNDTTTVWSSLGTLSLGFAQNGHIVVKRVI